MRWRTPDQGLPPHRAGVIVVEKGALTGALSDGKHLLRKVADEIRSRPAV